MTDAPKRRGRPPGSKNRPRVVEIGAHMSPMTATEVKIGNTVPFDQAGYAPEADPLEVPWDLPGSAPGTIKIVIWAKRAFGDDRSPDFEMDWPAGWRLPQTGDNIMVRPDWGGFVEYVQFDLHENKVKVRLR